ncbi:hypothetical protein [Herbaspirillum huttiense]|uniref:hypothetical protein n=1 Tax=Herbaspirillum huttiense TaxID=863372 RepID=UPI0031E28DF7
MNRLSEASTWAGLGVLFQVMKAFVPPAWQIYLDGASAAAAGVAGVIPEKGAAK